MVLLPCRGKGKATRSCKKQGVSLLVANVVEEEGGTAAAPTDNEAREEGRQNSSSKEDGDARKT